jgi:hypothetical protein
MIADNNDWSCLGDDASDVFFLHRPKTVGQGFLFSVFITIPAIFCTSRALVGLVRLRA